MTEAADQHDLLPQNATGYEKALSKSIARVSDVPVELEKLAQPKVTPPAFLPFVAWGLSVDVWPRRWDDVAKREALKSALPLHKVKGTAYAVRENIRMAGGEVVRFERPPATAFAGRNFTQEERFAWLQHYPELRTFPFRGKALRPRSLFAGHFYAGVGRLGDGSGPKGRYAVPSTAEDRAGRRTFMVDRGVETELKVTVRTEIVEQRIAIVEEVIHLPNVKPHRFFAACVRAKMYAGIGSSTHNVRLTHSVAWGAIKFDRKALIVTPSYGLIDPTPIERFETSQLLPQKCFAGRGLKRYIGHTFAMSSTAFMRVYDVVWLYDPDRHVPPRRGRFFAGYTRLGLPDYTAYVHTRIKRERRRFKFFAGQMLERRHAMAADRERLDDVLRGVGSAKSLRDEIFINLNLAGVAKAAVGLKCGTVKCGQMLEQ